MIKKTKGEVVVSATAGAQVRKEEGKGKTKKTVIKEKKGEVDSPHGHVESAAVGAQVRKDKGKGNAGKGSCKDKASVDKGKVKGKAKGKGKKKAYAVKLQHEATRSQFVVRFQ